MRLSTATALLALSLVCATELRAQKAPYDVFPAAAPPYYRVRYEESTKAGELPYAVNYTIWIPEGVKTEVSDRVVTDVFVERHIRIGIEALRLIRRHGKSVKHLRFDE